MNNYPSNSAGSNNEVLNALLMTIPSMASEPSGPTHSWPPYSDHQVLHSRPVLNERPKETSLAWFARNLEMLRKKFGRRWILIKDSEVIDASDDPTELQAVAEQKGIMSPYITKIPPSSTSWRTAY
jgi:hypothetical protein